MKITEREIIVNKDLLKKYFKMIIFVVISLFSGFIIYNFDFKVSNNWSNHWGDIRYLISDSIIMIFFTVLFVVSFYNVKNLFFNKELNNNFISFSLIICLILFILRATISSNSAVYQSLGYYLLILSNFAKAIFSFLILFISYRMIIKKHIINCK